MLRVPLCLIVLSAPAWAAETLTFEKHVRPILKTHCFHCHGEEGETKSGLDVRLARFIMKGGEDGPAIIPGKAAESHLLQLIKKAEMPKVPKDERCKVNQPNVRNPNESVWI